MRANGGKSQNNQEEKPKNSTFPEDNKISNGKLHSNGNININNEASKGGENEDLKDRKSNYIDTAANFTKSETNKQIIIDANVIVSKGTGDPFELYIKERKLGEGSYGKVYLVKHRILTSSLRAMKEIKKSSKDISKEAESDILNEINILKKLDHPNIVKIFEFYNQPDSFFLVTELCKEGELFKQIIKVAPFDEGFTAYIMYQILSCMFYCHSMGIIHRDLKPENILIESKERNGYLRIKIIDFGTAKIFEKGKIERKVIGSCYYIAPEVLLKNYNEKCDLWSCGVIMYILLSARPPFGGKNDSEIIQKIRVGSYELTQDPWNKISKDAKNLISLLLTKDPSQRISAEDALNHVWFKTLRTKEKLNELKKDKFKYVNNLKTYKSDKVLQSAALAYLVHNFNQNEEVREANKLFNFIDANGDGRITQSELLNGFKQMLSISEETLKEDVEKIFKNIDADNNGYIEYEEFVRAAIDKEKLLADDVLKFAFRYFDKDGSGEISPTELKEVFFSDKAKNDPVIQNQLEFIIYEVDTNGDGKISYEEFAQVMKSIIKE